MDPVLYSQSARLCFFSFDVDECGDYETVTDEDDDERYDTDRRES